MVFYVLDSDHLSLHQRGYDRLRRRLLMVPPDQIAITIISAEELIRGRLAQLRRSEKPERRVEAYQWLLKTLDFLCGFKIFNYDVKAEVQFQNLRTQKIKVGTQDLKIAAIALSQNCTLVSRNRRDF